MVIKNDKFKKKAILTKIENKWGYYEFDGNFVLVKNFIRNNKYNKIFQIIANAGESLDGLYMVNSYDITLFNNNNESCVKIINNKYDKIAGTEDNLTNSFQTTKEYTDWLIDMKFITPDELHFFTDRSFNYKKHPELIKFELE